MQFQKGHIPWNKGKRGKESHMFGRKHTLGLVPWNKGKKGVQTAWNKGLTKEIEERLNYERPTIFKKGENRGYRFPKGHIPWNKGAEHLCKGCNKKIPYWKKYCSRKCYFENSEPWHKGNANIKCFYCKKTFKRGRKKQRFCSLKCRSLYFSGENAHNWKGGKTHRKKYEKKWKKENHEKVLHYTRRRRIRKAGNGGYHSLEEWLKLKKDYGYTCPACKRKEPEIILTEDHIKPIIKGGTDNIENVQPLCKSCNFSKHDKTIKYNYRIGGK